MITARSPLRITFGGGGTDLPSYYRAHGGVVMSAAIDRYVRVSVRPSPSGRIVVRHWEVEECAAVDEVRHPFVREALQMLAIREALEIDIACDVPSGTGLGSSGSLSAALLKALSGRVVEASALAEMASRLEIERLGRPVGKQDAYAGAFGGIRCYTFHADDRVTAAPLSLAPETLQGLRERVLLFYTSLTRSAADILDEQDRQTRAGDSRMLEVLHEVKEIAGQSRAALERGDLDAFGGLLHRHWESKKRRSSRISSPQIDRWYRHGLDNGALGGNLVGAGGGGFLMFCAHDPARLRAAMAAEGLTELRFDFDWEGATIFR